ncbi:MAG: hypothetical protein AABX12_03815 [Nanoarchaeota archaeon]
MVELKCGCQVTDEGKFVVGDACRSKNCTECQTIAELHPFGSKRFRVNIG